MSTAAGTPSNGQGSSSPDRPVKGKGKHPVSSPDVSMEEDDEDDSEDDDDDDHIYEDDSDDVEGDSDIDPSEIIPSGRRTRGIKVDYTSAEALRKAGLAPERDEDEDEEDEAKHKDD